MKNKILFVFLFIVFYSFAFNVSAETYNLGLVTLKNGSKGEAVKELQRFLNTNLNMSLVIDGQLGPKTIMIIKKWQSDNGLVADGVIGTKTKIKINSIHGIVATKIPIKVSQNDECKNVTGYSCDEYKNGWKETFKKENNLSESEFNSYITITSVEFMPMGKNYELTIRYDIKKDWLLVNKIDSIFLGISPQLKPDQLPLERSVGTKGRNYGVSSVDIKSPLSFSSSDLAIEYFAGIYSQDVSKIKIFGKDFQYYWNVEKDSSNNAGQGGEPYLRLSGEINISQNKCFTGEISLINKKTVYREGPCFIN